MIIWTSHTCPKCGASVQAPLDDEVFCQHRRKPVLCDVIGRANVRAAQARRDHTIDKLIAALLTTEV